MDTYKVSERRACGLVKQPRATQRRPVMLVNTDAVLGAAIVKLNSELAPMGYRKQCRVLKERGWQVNHKRYYRLWTALGLAAQTGQKQRKRPGQSSNACHVRSAEHRNHVWTWDFVFDQTEDGVPLKWLSVSDEYTRECLALVPARSMTHKDIIDVLAELMMTRGKPKLIRSDNGPEFIAQALQAWLREFGSKVIYIEPGSPWQNGYSESFHAQVRREFLDRTVFQNVEDARASGTRYRTIWNTVRPHGALSMRTPAHYAASVTAPPQQNNPADT